MERMFRMFNGNLNGRISRVELAALFKSKARPAAVAAGRLLTLARRGSAGGLLGPEALVKVVVVWRLAGVDVCVGVAAAWEKSWRWCSLATVAGSGLKPHRCGPVTDGPWSGAVVLYTYSSGCMVAAVGCRAALLRFGPS